MPDNSQDYRALLDEKFNSIHTSIDLQFTNVNNQLANIQLAVNKTNGRVLSLEDKDSKHIINCPVVKRVDDIENNLKDASFFIRNPKIGIAIIVVTVIITLTSYFEIKTLMASPTPIKIESIK